MNVKVGVYRHFRDGRFYQVMGTVPLMDVVKKDQDVFICAEAASVVDPDATTWIVQLWARAKPERGSTVICIARAHADYAPTREAKGEALVWYLPLYHDKPGRRISVRAVSEFVEMVELEAPQASRAVGQRIIARTPRFTYVGDVIPSCCDFETFKGIHSAECDARRRGAIPEAK